MSNDTDDYAEQWVRFLSRGPYYFSKELLTPNIALLVSPDGSKIIVIGDTSGVRCIYGEQGSAVYVNFCRGGIGNSLTCPACGQYYIITTESHEQDDEIVFIQDDKDFYRCACGMIFVLYERYEFVSLPIDLEDLAPLYFAGLSQNADLLVRYILSQDGQSLVEEVSEVRKHWVDDSCLTERPGFKFEAWTIAPCFVACDSLHSLGVQNVRIWRKRKYKLKSDIFEEETYRAAWDSWDTVTRKVGYRGDSYANQRMLEALESLNENPSRTADLAQEQITKKPRGGDQRVEEIKRLWADTDVLKRFADLVDKLWLTWGWIKLNVDSSALASTDRQQEWVDEMWEKRNEIKIFAARHPKFTKAVLTRAVDDELIKIDRIDTNFVKSMYRQILIKGSSGFLKEGCSSTNMIFPS